MRDTRKIIQALGYLVSQQTDEKMDNMKAYKLLWLADRYHLRQYGRTITGDDYFALPYGAVPSNAKCILEEQDTKLHHCKDWVDEYLNILPNHQYGNKKGPDMSVFSDSDIQVMNLIIENFNHLSALELSNLSHQFPEWKHYENKLRNENEKKSYRIDINLFFENKEEESGLFVDDPQLLELTKAIYQQYKGY